VGPWLTPFCHPWHVMLASAAAAAAAARRGHQHRGVCPPCQEDAGFHQTPPDVISTSIKNQCSCFGTLLGCAIGASGRRTSTMLHCSWQGLCKLWASRRTGQKQNMTAAAHGSMLPCDHSWMGGRGGQDTHMCGMWHLLVSLSAEFVTNSSALRRFNAHFRVKQCMRRAQRMILTYIYI
jgi:hypothetical protein